MGKQQVEREGEEGQSAQECARQGTAQCPGNVLAHSAHCKLLESASTYTFTVDLKVLQMYVITMI
jgi:hypothetical protein